MLPSKAQALGSGTAALAEAILVSAEELLTVDVPSRFRSTVKANPSVASAVRAGIVPSESENMLKANVLPDVEVPSGESTAGPYWLTSKERLPPNVKLSK